MIHHFILPHLALQSEVRAVVPTSPRNESLGEVFGIFALLIGQILPVATGHLFSNRSCARYCVCCAIGPSTAQLPRFCFGSLGIAFVARGVARLIYIVHFVVYNRQSPELREEHELAKFDEIDHQWSCLAQDARYESRQVPGARTEDIRSCDHGFSRKPLAAKKKYDLSWKPIEMMKKTGISQGS